MKKLLTLFIGSSLLFTSCDYLQGYIKGASANVEDSLAAKDFYMAARDMSITAENAYSDVFLDSAAIENYIQTNSLPDTTARKMRSFYNSRNFQAAWLSSAGFTEQGRGLWNMLDGETVGKDSAQLKEKNKERIDSLMEVDTLQVSAADSIFVQTELNLTQQFVHSAKASWDSTGSLHRFYLPARKVAALQLADSILNKGFDSSRLQNVAAYTALKNELQRYYNLAKDSSWQPLTGSATGLKKGGSSPLVSGIKKRLAGPGDWRSADTSQLYSDSLHAAIVAFQKRHGLDSSGAITDTMLTLLNVTPQQRVEQILVNMNRMMWSPVEDSGSRVTVNIPNFMLYVYDGAQKAFEMPVVVGKEGTNTLMFNGRLNEVVFNPYWNIPASIVEKEIMPAMKADPNYLKKNNMEVVKSNDSIPQIRQLPGGNNSLGQVKFLFPNAYDIYLHDSPAKELFTKDKRAFSHGCIRVADAQKLAAHLLQGQNGWTPEKVAEAMKSGKEQRVTLQNGMPVYINYYTVWVDETGQVHYADDIYGHDARTRSMMFTTTGA